MLELANVRDIAIIVLALESIVVGILLGVLVVRVTQLSQILREEVLPILRSTQETMGTVRGTAVFVTDHVVQPMVKWSSATTGVKQALSTLLRGPGQRGRTDELAPQVTQTVRTDDKEV